MEIKELMDVYLAQVDNSDRFWALFSGIALALLGFVIANGDVLRRKGLRTILALAFGAFAALSCNSLYTSNKKLWAIAYEMRALAATPATATSTPIARTSDFRTLIIDRTPIQPAIVVSVHAVFSIFLILAIFYIPTIADSPTRKASPRNS